MAVAELEFEVDKKLVVATVQAAQLGSGDTQLIVDEMTEKLRIEGAIFFILDMSATQYIDSASVGSLVNFLRDLEHVRGKVALARCQPNVAFLFKVTKLDSVIPLYEDLDEAREKLVG